MLYGAGAAGAAEKGAGWGELFVEGERYLHAGDYVFEDEVEYAAV